MKVSQLEAQRKCTDAGAILIDAVDAVVQSGEFPEGVGLILLRIGLNFLGTDLEPNGIESIGDGLAQLHFDSKNLKKYLDQLARFLFDVVLQLGQAGKLEVAQSVMKVAFPLIEKVKFKDAEVITPIIMQGILSTLSGKVAEAQKFMVAATELNEKVKSAPVSVLLQLMIALISYEKKDYGNFLNNANALLEEAVKKENYHLIALMSGMMAKAFTSAGKGNDAYSWWATAEAAAGIASLKRLQAFARERKQELQHVLAAKAAATEVRKAPPPQEPQPAVAIIPKSPFGDINTPPPQVPQPVGQIIPKSPFGDSFTPPPRPPATVTPVPEPLISPQTSPVAPSPAPAPVPTSGEGSKKEELFHQIESVKQLIKDIDEALPTASDPTALRQQKALMRKKLRELQEEHDKFP